MIENFLMGKHKKFEAKMGTRKIYCTCMSQLPICV